MAEIEDHLRAEVADIEATKARGDEVWPIVDYADIEAGTVARRPWRWSSAAAAPSSAGTSTATQAEQWDADVVDYVDSNHFFENYAGPADDFFGTLSAEMSKPEIYPVYWSSAQMEARQHPRMAAVQAFLNSQWTSESDGRAWFDPEVDSLYPDRIRRRPPGANSGGLGTHLDPGTLDLWMTEGYQQHFRHLFDGDFASYDPWDAAYRTEADAVPGIHHVLGLPHVPGLDRAERDAQRPGRAAHGADPAGDGLPDAPPAAGRRAPTTTCARCSRTGRSRPTRSGTRSWSTPRPRSRASQPGDSVWWHCDMIHSVAPVTNQQGWGNVIYIPAAPSAPRTTRTPPLVREAFLAGESPFDFPKEDYEASGRTASRAAQRDRAPRPRADLGRFIGNLG